MSIKSEIEEIKLKSEFIPYLNLTFALQVFVALVSN